MLKMPTIDQNARVQTSLSKSCYSHIRELRCIRPYFDSKAASTIAASIVHSKLDYCNTIFLSVK